MRTFMNERRYATNVPAYVHISTKYTPNAVMQDRRDVFISRRALFVANVTKQCAVLWYSLTAPDKPCLQQSAVLIMTSRGHARHNGGAQLALL